MTPSVICSRAPCRGAAHDRAGGNGADADAIEQIVGGSTVMQEMCKNIGRIAPQDVNVLICGESGTGKELVARALYHHSSRADHPFLALNCGAFPNLFLKVSSSAMKRALHGGRPTTDRQVRAMRGRDAVPRRDRRPAGLGSGKDAPHLARTTIRAASGGKETIRTNVRILAATNQNLEKLTKEGRSRNDLYYRLKVVTIQLPPLRERGADVEQLTRHFLALYNRELKLSIREIDPEALRFLQQHAWPGNVRELQSVLKEAMLRTTGPILLPEFLAVSLRGKPAYPASANDPQAFDLASFIEGQIQRGEGDLYVHVIREVERLLFARVLQHTQGHQAQASDLLGLNRSTLRHKLRELGLSVEKSVQDTLPASAEKNP